MSLNLVGFKSKAIYVFRHDGDVILCSVRKTLSFDRARNYIIQCVMNIDPEADIALLSMAQFDKLRPKGKLLRFEAAVVWGQKVLLIRTMAIIGGSKVLDKYCRLLWDSLESAERYESPEWKAYKPTFWNLASFSFYETKKLKALTD